MGCYGIGINRIVAGAVEAGHDANGIIWPLAIAPYHVLVVPLPGKDPRGRWSTRPRSRRAWRRRASTCWSTTATSGRASSSRMPT